LAFFNFFEVGDLEVWELCFFFTLAKAASPENVKVVDKKNANIILDKFIRHLPLWPSYFSVGFTLNLRVIKSGKHLVVSDLLDPGASLLELEKKGLFI
jgi:uncharacterized membrane protein